MGEWVIVALPENGDRVWNISSEKIPHMTLLYFGEPAPDISKTKIAEFLEHAASLLPRFGLSVERRGTLGPDEADVLFFDKGFAERVTAFRDNLLKNEEISKAYNAVEQWPQWTPHLTLGYPDAPAKSDGEAYPVHYVQFDRIALWHNDFDGEVFELPSPDNALSVEMSAHPKTEEFLAHFGVKGMRWGFRKQRDGSVKKTGRTKSEDYSRARELQKKKPYELSNKELKELNERLNLEKNYKQLTGQKSRVDKGMAYLEKAQKVAKTGQELYNLANSPAGKAARGVIDKQLKAARK